MPLPPTAVTPRFGANLNFGPSTYPSFKSLSLRLMLLRAINSAPPTVVLYCCHVFSTISYFRWTCSSDSLPSRFRSTLKSLIAYTAMLRVGEISNQLPFLQPHSHCQYVWNLTNQLISDGNHIWCQLWFRITSPSIRSYYVQRRSKL